ncbi:MAG: HIT family protein [Nitrososphaerales archaeon]
MQTGPETKIRNSASVTPLECVFCRIVGKKLPSYLIFEDEDYIVFLDAAPFNVGHTLVCPKKHGETLWDMTEAEIGGLFALAAKISKAVVRATQMDGFRLVQNNGEAANQVVAHVHVHVIPVKLQEKGKWMDRKKVSQEEMENIARDIKAAL